ncbi:MAG: 2-oxo acid dehydrogenase subunit E2 [archaeon]|nr:2-oxo acid dehydrogenase subunit E2 [archaeon]
MNALLVIFFITYGIYSFFNNINFWLIFLTLVLTYIYTTQMFKAKEYLSRKVSIATWSAPYDPQTYTSIKLNITKVVPYLEKISAEIGDKITLTIYTIKLMAIILKKHPEVYGFIRLGRYFPKETVDICCLVQVGGGKELANTTIIGCESKSFSEISKELKNSVALLRERKNKDQVKKMNIFKYIPTL